MTRHETVALLRHFRRERPSACRRLHAALRRWRRTYDFHRANLSSPAAEHDLRWDDYQVAEAERVLAGAD